jgi:hypothetical protein
MRALVGTSKPTIRFLSLYALATLLSMLVVRASFAVQYLNKSQHQKRGSLYNSTGTPRYQILNINNMSMWVHADGRSGQDPYTDNWGVTYPRGTAGVVYADGIN